MCVCVCVVSCVHVHVFITDVFKCPDNAAFAQNDRILFHYNGHGVPKPTQNGEIWVFNKVLHDMVCMCVRDSVCVYVCVHYQWSFTLVCLGCT